MNFTNYIIRHNKDYKIYKLDKEDIMNEKWVKACTSNICTVSKGFEKGNVKNIPTKEWIETDDGRKFQVEMFENTRHWALNAKYPQFGIGTNHYNRGCFVVDSDTNLEPSILYRLFTDYFVEPSVMLRNPTSGHTQTFFFFDKDVYTHSKYGLNKVGKRFLKCTHKLNSWLNIGDVHFTGWWAKNPYCDEFEKYYDSGKTYPFNTLCILIEECLDFDLTWEHIQERYEKFTIKEYTMSISDLASLALEADSYTQEEIEEMEYTDVEYAFDCPKVEFKKVEEREAEVATESKEEKVKEERRGKFKEGSENRHSILFHLMATYTRNNGYDKDKLEALVLERNKQFNNPLSVKEIYSEVMNATTMNKTLRVAAKWHDSKVAMRGAYDELYRIVSEECKGDEENIIRTLHDAHTWSYHTIARYLPLAKEYEKEENSKRYEGRYEGRYEDTKARNKLECKVRNYYKKNGKPCENWSEETLQVYQEMVAAQKL